MAETETAPAAGAVSADEKTWALIAHLSPLSGYVIPIPFVNIIAPLLIWKIKGDGMPFVADQAKEALNFNITVFIAALICIPLMFVLIGFFLLGILVVAALILMIVAALKANKGEAYRYPFVLRLVK